MHPSSRPRESLARSTLLRMGLRIAVIIALTTLASYFHVLHTLRTAALVQLEKHVSERSQREDAIFLLAEDNHAALRKALEERLGTLTPEEVGARFDRLFVGLPDGSVRNRPELFDGTRMPCLFIPTEVLVDGEMRRLLLASHDVLLQYGPALHTRFTNTFITLPEGPVLLYWPGRPTYCQDAAPDFAPQQMEYFRDSLPARNPERKTIWTGTYTEDVSGLAMVTSGTPVDLEGRQLAAISHDVLLEDLMTRTLDDHLPGAYNVLFRNDGGLIAQPPGSGTAVAHLRDLVERVRTRPAGEKVLELPEHEEYLAVGRLRGPDWNFVTVLPERVVSQPAFQAARYVLLLGILSLLLELAILYWVLQQQLSRPLRALTRATGQVASGDFLVELDTSRRDELGQLAQAFQLMAEKVRGREEELRQANEGLEQRVEARTRELTQVHAQLVRTARQAGMAEIATNVLHNVGNVLNSVFTSAQLAQERMRSMRLEQVGRVAQLLQERQGDLPHFLTQDERGRHLTPFLDKLGENLVDERAEVVSLLDDVGWYTEHIGDIVKVQQDYARTPRLHEPVVLGDLVEDALRINLAGLTRHQVRVVRNLAHSPPVLTDKHKLLMILVNLVSNAKYALDGVPPAERCLSVKLEHTPPGRVRIEIHDNGMGIAPELLTRIFQYGFTTREDGHGFGLHSSALAAKELGGALTVHSDGPGKGATFTLELPAEPAP